MTDDSAGFTNALAQGGPINGGSVSFANPPEGVVRGATFVLSVDDTLHEYRLQPTGQHPFQAFVYQGVPVPDPFADIVDR